MNTVFKTAPTTSLSYRPPAGVPVRRPMHPGVWLDKTVFRPLELSQTELAKQLGISRRRVNEMVQGQRALSVDTAILLAERFQLPANYLLGLQADWDSYQAWHERKQLSHKPNELNTAVDTAC